VPVLFENQVVGHTNRRGRLFVPNVNAYYPASYAIDPLQLPAGLRVPATEQRVAIRHGSGAIVRFALERFTAATVALVDRASQPLPLGARVLHRESGVVNYVGWGGIVFIEGLSTHNSLVVTTPDGAQCAVTFAADPTNDEIARIGPLTCRGQ
jgi:outer membrane usher protein